VFDTDNKKNNLKMGSAASTIDPVVFDHVKQEYENNKGKMTDEEMFNHISNEIKAKTEAQQKNTETTTTPGLDNPPEQGDQAAAGGGGGGGGGMGGGGAGGGGGGGGMFGGGAAGSEEPMTL
jgi:hypothetical protein